MTGFDPALVRTHVEELLSHDRFARGLASTAINVSWKPKGRRDDKPAWIGTDGKPGAMPILCRETFASDLETCFEILYDFDLSLQAAPPLESMCELKRLNENDIVGRVVVKAIPFVMSAREVLYADLWERRDDDEGRAVVGVSWSIEDDALAPSLPSKYVRCNQRLSGFVARERPSGDATDITWFVDVDAALPSGVPRYLLGKVDELNLSATKEGLVFLGKIAAARPKKQRPVLEVKQLVPERSVSVRRSGARHLGAFLLGFLLAHLCVLLFLRRDALVVYTSSLFL